MKQNIFPVIGIIPSLNPDHKLFQVVSEMFENGFSDIIVVDDGSRSECQTVFKELEHLSGCTVLHHDSNQGKGHALKTAFAYYLEHFPQDRYIGVVTADADGQHLPEDIFKTAKALLNSTPNTLALGTRDFSDSSVPFKSRFGNRMTTLVFRLLYGKLIHDTQTGLRAFTNPFVQKCLSVKGERFEYEINMLISAAQNNLEIIETFIQTVYFENNRETHFRPVKDSLRIYWVMLASFVRFACSGLISFIADQGFFYILQNLVFFGMIDTIAIPASSLIARIFSSFLNYSLNRTIVFDSGKSTKTFLVRYYLLCFLQLTVSAASVTVLRILTLQDSSLLKIIVDIFLFFISYQIQRKWVFKERSSC